MKTEIIGIWRERLTVVADDTSETVYSEVVPPGELWHIDEIGVKDNTTAAADCEVYLDTAGYKHHYWYFANVGTVFNQNATAEIWLREGERLGFDWTSVVAADILEMHISGEKHKIMEA